MTVPSNGSYGGKGPLILAVIWTEMSFASILFVLRARTASVYHQGQIPAGLFGLQWDFVWVILAFVCEFFLYPTSQGMND